MFESLLGSIGGGIMSGLSGGISSAVGGLFGGKKKSKGPSAVDLMNLQEQAQYRMAQKLPGFQVEGMRAAGLNPILTATHGPAQGQMPTSGAVDDRMVGLQEASVRSQIANQSAQANLYNAQAEKTQAETETESHRPLNVAADTGVKMAQPRLLDAQTRQALASGDLAGATQALQQQLAKTEEWKTRTATVETFLKNFEYELSLKNMPPKQNAEIRHLTAKARLAETEADLNDTIREIEKKLGVAGQAAGIARSIFGRR